MLDFTKGLVITLEAGATHGGFEGARALVLGVADAATHAGPETQVAIKFQHVWAGTLSKMRGIAEGQTITYKSMQGDDVEVRLVDAWRSRELTWDAWEDIAIHCHSNQLPWFTTPDGVETVEILGMASRYAKPDAIKVAGADMGRIDLIAACAKLGVPVLLDSRGDPDQLVEALRICSGVQTVIVHTPTGYPAPDQHIERVSALRDEYPSIPIGFTSHGTGWLDCLEAIERGATYVEKGITADRGTEGIEHWLCIEPRETVEFILQCEQKALA